MKRSINMVVIIAALVLFSANANSTNITYSLTPYVCEPAIQASGPIEYIEINKVTGSATVIPTGQNASNNTVRYCTTQVKNDCNQNVTGSFRALIWYQQYPGVITVATGTPQLCCPSGQEEYPQGSQTCIPKCPELEPRNEQGVCEPCESGRLDIITGKCIPLCAHTGGIPGFCDAAKNCCEPQCGPGEVIIPPSASCQPTCDYPQIIKPDDGSCYTPECGEGEERPTPDSACVPMCDRNEVRQPDGSCKACPQGTVPDGYGGCEADPYACPEGFRHSIEGDNTSRCELIPITCAQGYHQVGKDCVKDAPDMPEPTPTSPPEPAPTPPGPTDPNPDSGSPDPTPPATPDPAAPPAERSDQRLGSIDKNIAKILNGQGVQTQILRNIANNQAKAVSNLAAIGEKIDTTNEGIGEANATLNKISGSVDGLETDLNKISGSVDGLETGVNNIDGTLKGIDGTLKGMKTNETGPELPIFNSAIDEPEKYHENETPNVLAQQQVQEDIANIENKVIPSMPFTVTTDITSDACVSWDVLGSHCEFCFDKPWILAALQIMKVVLIAIGYFQAFQLANRALVG